MTGLDIFTFVVLAVLVAVGLYAAFVLGELPGRIAEKREHPQAEAIRVAGWIGLLTLGVLWPFALIWAYTRPNPNDEIAALHQTVERLGERVAAVERDRSRNLDEADW
jgi:NADH:ubiquinone oxidoreductase subunit 6 (subunit J)